MSDCLFCKIISGQIKSERVLDGRLVTAIKDINPQAPVHVLLLPKRHIDRASEATPEEMAEIFSSSQMIAEKLGVAASGFRIVVNQGKDAGQAVPHLHFHLLGGRPLAWPPG